MKMFIKNNWKILNLNEDFKSLMLDEKTMLIINNILNEDNK